MSRATLVVVYRQGLLEQVVDFHEAVCLVESRRLGVIMRPHVRHAFEGSVKTDACNTRHQRSTRPGFAKCRYRHCQYPTR
jgi:hypothetical protein